MAASKEDKKKKGREAAVAWLRDGAKEPPTPDLVQHCLDLLLDVVNDRSDNAFETTPHLALAVARFRDLRAYGEIKDMEQLEHLEAGFVQRLAFPPK
jgi:hypothetical protein